MVLLGALVGMLGVGAAEAGEILGTVKLAGPVPPVGLLYSKADHAVCGAEPRPSEALLLSPSGSVKNAVVSIAYERLEGWRSPTTFQIDQRRCAFVPRVLIIPPGAIVEVLNSDGILHNYPSRYPGHEPRCPRHPPGCSGHPGGRTEETRGHADVSEGDGPAPHRTHGRDRPASVASLPS